MKILYKYISVQFIKTFITLILLFSLIIVSSQLLHLPSFVYSMNIIDFLNILTLLDISFIKFQLLFGFFIGWLLVGIRIRENNEIYAIYSLGIDDKQLSKPILIWTVVFTLVALIFSSIVVPYANRERAKFLTVKVKSYIMDSIQPKNFSKITENIYVYVDEKRNNNFKNIILHNRSNGFLITAKDGYFYGSYVIFENGYIQLPSKNSYSILKFQKYNFNIDVSYVKEIAVEDLKISDIIKNIPNNKNKMIAILVDRLYFSIPFVFIGIIGFFMGIKFQKSRETLLSIAALIGIVYMTLNYLLVKLTEKNIAFSILYLIILILFFLALYKISKNKK
ncbi:MAG: LptF/LptG family permease [Hydrogenothermaceae bacterium]|nr:LptF/LptG family permease [Hydrogenothermaceae bacterium]